MTSDIVGTDLSLGTNTSTILVINSSTGDNVQINEATTSVAGLLGAVKWDEIVANSAFTATPSTVIGAGTGIAWTGNTLNVTGSSETLAEIATNSTTTANQTFATKADTEFILEDQSGNDFFRFTDGLSDDENIHLDLGKLYVGNNTNAIRLLNNHATETGTGLIGINYSSTNYTFIKIDGNNDKMILYDAIAIQKVDNGAKTASFTYDAISASGGAYTLSTAGAVTISIHNLESGMTGTIDLDIATNPSAITVNTYSDAGTTGLTEVVIGNAIANEASKMTTITYSCRNNGTATYVKLIYGQE